MLSLKFPNSSYTSIAIKVILIFYSVIIVMHYGMCLCVEIRISENNYFILKYIMFNFYDKCLFIYFYFFDIVMK